MSRIVLMGGLVLVSLFVAGCSQGDAGPDPGPDTDLSSETGFKQYGEDLVGEIVTVDLIMPGDSEPTSITVEAVDGRLIYQGDIVLGDVEMAEHGAIDSQGIVVRRFSSSLWENGIVPYRVSSRLYEEIGPGSVPIAQHVRDAIRHWERNTPIRFIEITDDNESLFDDYVYFVWNAYGCTSSVGRRGGVQLIDLTNGCGLPQIIHEIGHAVGLWHEQSRSDRNDYVEIRLENVKAGPGVSPQADYYHHNFARLPLVGRDIGEYDYDSIMHYPTWAFAENEGACMQGEMSFCTVVPTQEGVTRVGQGRGLSEGDISTVYDLYPSKIYAASLSPAYLYSVELGSLGADVQIGRVASVPEITDLATCPDGSLYASSFSNLYRVEKATAVASLIGPFGTGQSVNSLACSSSGELYAGAGTSRSDTGRLLAVDMDTGQASEVGTTGTNGFVGDIAFGPRDVLYGVVYSGSEQNGYLAIIDTDTGETRLVGRLGVPNIFGLTFNGDRLFGLRSRSNFVRPYGELVAIDPLSGDTQLIRSLSFNPSAAAPMGLDATSD